MSSDENHPSSASGDPLCKRIGLALQLGPHKKASVFFQMVKIVFLTYPCHQDFIKSPRPAWPTFWLDCVCLMQLSCPFNCRDPLTQRVTGLTYRGLSSRVSVIMIIIVIQVLRILSTLVFGVSTGCSWI